ncbi:unnamed protein product [Euphydryas editha]|uniref:PiggyBac transposable element-derived protein domain-containing protein n=1 Tax=Euphydryas editha TaxID=104508 RepID=A0AAU9UU16_EUPED|nr:unnamed protein product [Euphydryas editha]
MSRRLQERDIEELLAALENGDMSDDGLEDENEDEDVFYPNSREILEELTGEDEEAEDEETTSQEVDPHQDSDPVLVEDASQEGSLKFVFDKRRLIWKLEHLTYDDNKIAYEHTACEPDIADLDTPYRCFLHYFSPDFLQKISDETNLYCKQTNPSNPFSITAMEVKKFIGILLFMSVEHFPSVRSYWNEKFGYEPIKKVMPVNRFEMIRSFLHFNNNENHLPPEHPNHDRLYKLRPVIDHLNKKFASVPLDQRVSIDEQMCSTKIGHFLKQYLPNKPHKWGYKLFVLCSLMGYAYRFEVYSGQEDKRSRLSSCPEYVDEPDLGVTNNVVLRLARIIPRMRNHIVFFDNFYTSLPLIYYSSKQGIHCVGTVQQNRLPNCRLPDKKQLMKTSVPRGTYEERVSHHDGVDFSATVWKDNKVVTLLSSYVGSQPEGYNICTCGCIWGVDLMNSYLGRYRIRVKSRKWYLRLFYHLLDLAVINAWILMKKNCIAKGIPKKQLPNLGEFRNELADALCNVGSTNGNKRGRPTNGSLENNLKAKMQKGSTHPLPSKDVRKDGIDHYPVFSSRLRCKIPGCTGTTQWSCTKCNVPLCLNARNNCFITFHTQ